jgi:7-carboxy-7-deazaguanine synthase
MRISEIFYSIQGEGVLAGMPSVFIRTSGCNLRCRWCDTPYASWKPEGENMSVAEILTAIQEHPTRYIVVTGGEPMVAVGIHELIHALRSQGKHVTLETAGTVAPAGLVVDLVSLSPKLANSTPTEQEAGAAWVERHEKTRCQPECIAEWVTSALSHQLKFVISTAANVQEMEALISKLPVPLQPENILLMPEGTDLETLRQRYELIIDTCKTHGYRFSPRLHIEWFGNRRGT